jgi:hypothetical protein
MEKNGIKYQALWITIMNYLCNARKIIRRWKKRYKISGAMDNYDDAVVLGEAFLNAGVLLGLTHDELNNVAGCDVEQEDFRISPDSKEGELALYFIRSYKKLYGQFGGSKEQMQLWMKVYNTGTGGIPIEQVQNIAGLVHVMEYLEAFP